MLDLIPSVPSSVQCRILSFLPHQMIKQLQLTNKQAWIIFNSRRSKTLEWNDQIDWITELMDCRLTVSEQLYIFTLSDLHSHTSSENHWCRSLYVPKKTTFKLMPIQQANPPKAEKPFLGFMLKNVSSPDIPWDKYRVLHRNQGWLSHDALPASSAAYSFAMTKLGSDRHFQDHLGMWGVNDIYDIDDHIAYCDECDYETSSDGDSDVEYIPSEGMEESDSQGEGSEVSVGELMDLKEDFQEMTDTIEKSRREKHRASVESSQKKSIAKWADVDYSSDSSYEPEYDPFTGNIYGRSTKRRWNPTPPSEHIKNLYCHNFNNGGSCHIGKNCWYRHEKAPL